MTNWMALTGDGGVATADQIAAAFETARRALELDPRDPVAHAALGSIYLMVGDPQNAVDATRRAVELNPSMPVAWVWFGWAQVLAGNPEACIVATERAQRLDPHFPTIWIYDSLALAHWEAGNYEASLTAGRRLVATHPTYLTGHLYVAMSAVSLGRIDEARAAIAEGVVGQRSLLICFGLIAWLVSETKSYKSHLGVAAEGWPPGIVGEQGAEGNTVPRKIRDQSCGD